LHVGCQAPETGQSVVHFYCCCLFVFKSVWTVPIGTVQFSCSEQRHAMLVVILLLLMFCLCVMEIISVAVDFCSLFSFVSNIAVSLIQFECQLNLIAFVSVFAFVYLLPLHDLDEALSHVTYIALEEFVFSKLHKLNVESLMIVDAKFQTNIVVLSIANVICIVYFPHYEALGAILF
jgi:hypothetical protein